MSALNKYPKLPSLNLPVNNGELINDFHTSNQHALGATILYGVAPGEEDRYPVNDTVTCKTSWCARC